MLIYSCFYADETEGDAVDYSHVLGTVAATVAREIVLERNVERPVHAFDAPVTARPGGKPLDIEWAGGDIVARLERTAIGVFDAREDLDERLDVGESRFAGVTPVGDDPVDIGV